jgi:hypothetical protein
MKKLISVLNEKVAPWMKWKTGLHTLILAPIKVSTKQPLKRKD